MKKYFLIILILIISGPFSGSSQIVSFRSAQSGVWSSTTTWEQYIGGAWTTATRTPVYGDRVIIRATHTVDLNSNLSYNGTETNGFALLDVALTGNLITSGTGSSLSIVIGAADTLNVIGSMSIGCFQVQAGAIALIRSTGTLTTNNCPVTISASSPPMAINGSLTVSSPSSLNEAGNIWGTGTVIADIYTGSGKVYGSTQTAGQPLFAAGFIWNSASTGSWFTVGKWLRSTSSDPLSDMIPNDTLRVTVPSFVTGNITVDDPINIAHAYSLIIRSGKKVTVAPNGNLQVINNLDNQAGNDGLVINSDATGSGSVILPLSAEVTPATTSATVNIYITGSTELNAMKYHFISLPVDAATNSTSNIFLGSYLYDFNEGTNSWDNLGSSTTIPLDETRGYMIYYQGASTTISIPGKLNNGKYTPLMSYISQGYNLVPNPYSSTIDWNTSGNPWKKDGIGGTFYIWPAGAASATENYASYNGTAGVNGGSRYIALGQSFIVQVVNSSYDFSMTNAVCTNQHANFLKNNELIPTLLWIKSVTLNNNAYDEIVVHFREGATTAFDPEFDGNKLQGGAEAPQFSSVASDNSELCINSLPITPGEVIVPLHFTLNVEAQVSFTASGMASFNANVPVTLEDQLLGKMVNLRHDSVYTFNYEPANAIDRFRLHFAGLNGTEEHSIISGRAFAGKGKIFLEVPAMEGQEADISIFNTMGQLVSGSSVKMNGFVSVEAPGNTGIFIVHAASADQHFVAKVFNKQ
ncbi:MAG: hypothetical protein NTW31_08020 [Bacteroidetes bacterium]|nr:hypothetical protein [Bacteroidota bacterium]